MVFHQKENKSSPPPQACEGGGGGAGQGGSRGKKSCPSPYGEGARRRGDNRERKTERRLNKRDIFSVHPSFAISLNIKDKDLILSLQSYFGVGRVKQDLGNNAITYYVNSVKDLTNIIIPFFNKYPLVTQKRADYLLFKQALESRTAPLLPSLREGAAGGHL